LKALTSGSSDLSKQGIVADAANSSTDFFNEIGTKLTFAQLPETRDEQTFTPPRLRVASTQIRFSSTAWNTLRLVALPA
jgi:hypothetical protein